MGGSDFPVFAVTEMNGCHSGCHFQHFAGTPFQSAYVTYNIPDFDCHWFLPFCLN
jgi:hypothetical protein